MPERALARARVAGLVAAALLAQACVDSTTNAYAPVTVALDGDSELHISTYPAGYPRTKSRIPFLYKSIETPDSVYFQLFVRAAGTTFGRNPHIDSVCVHRFAYAFPGQAPVVLAEDFDDGFWMQGNPEHSEMRGAPVPYSDGWYLQIEVDLSLNGERYRIQERSEALSESSVRPLIFDAMR